MLKSNTISFNFNELEVSPENVAYLMGFDDGIAPELFSDYINEVIEFAKGINNISGYYQIYDNVDFNTEDKITRISKIEFRTGKIVTNMLKKANSIAVFVCTAGFELEGYSKNQMQIGNMPEGYIADLLGSTIVEAAMDKIQQKLAEQLIAEGLNITNRYSPGYCSWNVSEQQKLFQLIPQNICGISLSDSSLMQPIKSVSGFIGIGTEVKFNNYTCNICDSQQCIYRNKKKKGI